MFGNVKCLARSKNPSEKSRAKWIEPNQINFLSVFVKRVGDGWKKMNDSPMGRSGIACKWKLVDGEFQRGTKLHLSVFFCCSVCVKSHYRSGDRRVMETVLRSHNTKSLRNDARHDFYSNVYIFRVLLSFRLSNVLESIVESARTSPTGVSTFCPPLVITCSRLVNETFSGRLHVGYGVYYFGLFSVETKRRIVGEGDRSKGEAFQGGRCRKGIVRRSFLAEDPQRFILLSQVSDVGSDIIHRVVYFFIKEASSMINRGWCLPRNVYIITDFSIRRCLSLNVYWFCRCRSTIRKKCTHERRF